MILLDILREDESNAAYRLLRAENVARQHDFTVSLVKACISTNSFFLSQHAIKLLHFHALAGLQPGAGEYREHDMLVADRKAPRPWSVAGQMDDLVNRVNRSWNTTDPVSLGTFAYWQLNHIHLFRDGNGRTARAVAYFVLCLKAGRVLEGSPSLPTLLDREKVECFAALTESHAAFDQTGEADLRRLLALFERLVGEQIGPARIEISSSTDPRPQGETARGEAVEGEVA